MDSAPKGISSHERAAALIIVLAFVVLLTVLVLAYFSRATSDRPVAQSSFHQSKVDQVAVSGMELIIGDLRQEIVNGSASPAPLSVQPLVRVHTISMCQLPTQQLANSTCCRWATPLQHLARRQLFQISFDAASAQILLNGPTPVSGRLWEAVLRL